MKHTTTAEQNLAHIDRLRTHGAKVRINGELKEIALRRLPISLARQSAQ